MPNQPTITLTPEAASGRMKIDVANSDTPGSGNNIWRQFGSESAIKIATGVAVDGVYYDSHIASGKAYTYFAEAVDSGVTAQGATKTDSVSLSKLWLHAVDKLSGSANALFAVALDNMSPEQRNLSREEASYDLSGRDVPLIYASRIKAHTFNCLIRILQADVANRATILDILHADRYVCVRNPNGLKLFGVLANVSFDDFTFYTDFHFEMREVDFRETQDWTRTTTISTATGSYSVTDIDKALAGFYFPPKYKVRVEHLDRKNNVLNSDFQNLDLSRSSIRLVADADVVRTGRFTILEQKYDRELDLDAYPDLVIDNSPLFYWRLGDTSGTVAADASGNGRTGTYNGGFTLAQPSLLAGALDNGSVKLNGSTGYVSIADAAWMDVSFFTVEAVIRSNSTTNFPTIFDRYNTGQEMIRFNHGNTGFGDPGELRLTLGFTTGSPTAYQTEVKTIDDTPHHVAATYDGSFVRIFVDGIQVLKTAETRTLKTGTQAIRVGATNAGTDFFNGYLDEVAFYDHALSPAELRLHAKRALAQYREVDYLYDRLKIYIGLRMSDGNYAEWPDGLFLLKNPKPTSTDKGITVEVDAYDKGMFVKNWKFSGRYVVAASTNVVTAIQTLLAAAGFETSEYQIATSSLTTAAALEFDDKSSYLDAINTLLYSINYENLFANGTGILIGQPYELPKDRATTRTYVDDQDSIICGDIQIEDNLVEVPNEINLTDTTPGVTPKTATESNVGWTNDFTVEKRGQTVREGEDVVAVNQTILDALALRELTERTTGRMVTFRTPHVPFHERRDILRLRFINDPHKPDIDDRFIEVELEIPLNEVTDGVTHHCKQIIPLS